jgi:nitrite reductase (NO-forming)
MFTRREALIGAAMAAAAAAIPLFPAMAQPTDVSALPHQKVSLVAPPFVHEHEQVATSGPKVVEFAMTIEEKPIVIDDEGTTLRGMTFNGSIPGPMMVVHEGDYLVIAPIAPPPSACMPACAGTASGNRMDRETRRNPTGMNA